MGRKSLKVIATMMMVVAATTLTSNVALARSGHHHSNHHSNSVGTTQYASCYQNGICTGNGCCDANGICQNGGYCGATTSGNHHGNGNCNTIASCYQNGICTGNGCCDANGVCQNGGICGIIASCCQNGICTTNGSCDVNGVCQNGGICNVNCQNPNQNNNTSTNTPFCDVSSGSWYCEYTTDVYEKGYMSGKGNGKFEPESQLTRAEVVTILHSMNNKPNAAFVNQFSDVESNSWYSNAVSWAYQNSIVSGYANGKFGVNDSITREQLALMLYQYANNSGYDINFDNNILLGFEDTNKVNTWASAAMKWAVSQGMISGKGNGKLDPQGKTTRAECATIISHFSECCK